MLAQNATHSPWRDREWWVRVQEHRISDAHPYDLASVQLNVTDVNIVGQSELVSRSGDTLGLAVFQSYPGALRAGTTNVHWHFSNSTYNSVWVRSLRLHRSIAESSKVSARLELFGSRDSTLIYQQQWLWSEALTSNIIEHTIPVDGIHGPVDLMRLSFWGSGYSALSALELCTRCVTPSVTPSPSVAPSPGHQCDTGAKGVCAAGTWQRDSATGVSVCVMNTLPSAERCDALDNDCDGLVDEDFVGRVFDCGQGECRRSVPQCYANGTTGVCVPGEPVAERCDLLDNDCNGLVDDAMPLLSCGVGACARNTSSCIEGIAQHCVAGEPTFEQCDGVDNNCNGRVDERNVCNLPFYAMANLTLVVPVLECVERLPPTCTAHMHLEGTATVNSSLLYLLSSAHTLTSDTLLPPKTLSLATRSLAVPFSCDNEQLLWQVNGRQTLQVDAFSLPLCGTTADITPVMVPFAQDCVRRLDGYCSVEFGYFVDTAAVSVPIGNTTNWVQSSSSTPLAQDQPTSFYRGRVYDALSMRTECTTATLSSWWMSWRLGTQVALVTADDLCV